MRARSAKVPRWRFGLVQSWMPAKSGHGAPSVLIRPPRASDEWEFLSLRRANRDWLEPWEPSPPPGLDLFSPDGFQAWVDSAVTEHRRRFLICRASDGVVLGQASLGEIIRGPLQQAFLGYWIAREHARQGLMREALPLVLRVAFSELRLHRVEANIQPHNTASIALARSVGFRREGFSPGYLQIQGVWSDHERWAMLADEFFARHGR